MIVTEKQNKELLKEMKETELILMGLRMEKQLLLLLVQGLGASCYFKQIFKQVITKRVKTYTTNKKEYSHSNYPLS